MLMCCTVEVYLWSIARIWILHIIWVINIVKKPLPFLLVFAPHPSQDYWKIPFQWFFRGHHLPLWGRRRQTLKTSVVAILPRTLIGWFENVLRSFSHAEAIHRAVGVVIEMLSAKASVWMLQTLAESTIEFAVIFPKWIFAKLVQVELPHHWR